MKFQKIVRHPFDVICGDLVTERDAREIVKRYYDFDRWCKENTTKEYELDRVFRAEGIGVKFAASRDYKAFSKFADDYWIHLHE